MLKATRHIIRRAILDDKTPLGYVDLADGRKAVYAMNDFFLNYMFKEPDEQGRRV
jgi:hypothetical protein